MHPLDEIKALDRQIDEIRSLADLRPIFYRLDEIAKQNSDDFEVQLATSELKERVVARGTTLRALGQTLHSVPIIGNSPSDMPAATSIPAIAADGPPPFDPSAAPDNGQPGANGAAYNSAPVPPYQTANYSPSYPPSYPPQPSEVEGVPQDRYAGQETSLGNAYPPPAYPQSAYPPPPYPPVAPPNVTGSSPAPLKRALLVGGLVGVLIAGGLIAYLVNRSHKRTVAATAVVPLSVVTAPDGASIRINGEAKCVSNCSIAVAPGDYQVTAFLDGYEPALGNLKVSAKQPAELSLTLTPQSQTIRILTDQQPGKVTLDDRPPADLQDGQFMFEKVAAGTHQLKVSTKSGDAAFTVEMADGALPKVQGPVSVKDVSALLVSSLANHARVVTTNAAKLTVNGQPQGDTGPAGVDVNGFHPGAGEFAIDDGKNQRTMSETFGPAPALTVFLKSDVTTGTLVIDTGEDDTRIFLNGKEYPRKTKKGEVRLQTLGSVAVRVAKDGFEVAPPQTAEVKKGSETRVTFKLQAIPKFGLLQVRGATPGAEVLIDQKSQGTVADDGSLSAANIPPGDHLIEVHKDQFVGRRFQRTFVAGQTINLAGPEVALLSSLGTVKIARTPADAAVQYRRTDEAQPRDLRGDQVDLAPGVYIFTARAQGFSDKAERVQVANGETRSVEFALARVAAAAPPPVKVAGIGDFQDPDAWTKDGDMWVHKGAGFIPFRPAANGTFTFTVRSLKGGNLFRGGRVRWAVQYVDGKNYALFELDRKTLASKVIEGGKAFDRGKYETGLSDKDSSFTVQVEIAPGQLMHSVRDGAQWRVLDTWKEPGRNFTAGKFGFLLQGNDEIGLTDFKFVPR